jgi:plastocyanin
MRLAPAFIAVFTLLWSAIPAAAHDPVAGVPDVTVVIASSVGDHDVHVAAGDIVRFVNRDDERHRLRSRNGPVEFDTGNLSPGESFQVRFIVAGTSAYVDERDRDDVRYHGRIVVGNSTTDGTGDGTGDSASAAGTASVGSGGGAATSATVTIGDRVFEPASTTVAVGGTVTFRNADGDEHTATSTDGGGIDSGTLGTGASYEATFVEPGTFAFLCAFHSDMRGSIQVVAATGAAAPPPAAPLPSVTAPAPAAEVAPPGAVAPASAAPSVAGAVGDAAIAPAAPAPASSRSDQGSLIGIVLSVTLVSVAVALFARLVSGTVRQQG